MTRPDYITRGGDLVMAPPFAQKGTTMYSFLVYADLGALTHMIDSQLNAVSARAGTTYKPFLPMAAIVCAQLTQSYSLTPPDSQKGWMGERDFAIWVPVLAGSQQNGIWIPDRICWYLPYVFVDNVAAMVTGREVYGFFKQAAALAMPAAPWSPGLFSIDALVIPTFSPQSQAQTLRLMTLTSCDGSTAPGSPEGGWTDTRTISDAVWTKIKQRFFDPAAGLPVTDWDVIKDKVEGMISGDVPMVFLKQFRDAGVEPKACYQAVIEASAHCDKLYAGWFTAPHDVAILPCASHPIVPECGLSGQTVRSDLGFWTRMDFTMQPGKVIAEAS